MFHAIASLTEAGRLMHTIAFPPARPETVKKIQFDGMQFRRDIACQTVAVGGNSHPQMDAIYNYEVFTKNDLGRWRHHAAGTYADGAG
jgi:hypothetical protein